MLPVSRRSSFPGWCMVEIRSGSQTLWNSEQGNSTTAPNERQWKTRSKSLYGLRRITCDSIPQHNLPRRRILDQRVQHHLDALHPLLHQFAQPLVLAKLGDVLTVQEPAHFLDQRAQLLVVRHVLLAERIQEL